jgi:hypothetical protein
MKKRVPPIAHNNPKDTAICIHSFRFSGTLSDIIPDKRRGTPSKEGKKEVIELDFESIDMIMPHIIKKLPSPIVILGILWPATVNSSPMTRALVEPLKLLGVIFVIFQHI